MKAILKELEDPPQIAAVPLRLAVTVQGGFAGIAIFRTQDGL